MGGGKGYLFTGHHESHAASAYFPSPYDKAAILTIDGVGEWDTASIGHGKGNRIELSEVEATSDRVLIINNGKIVAQGTPKELMAKGSGTAVFITGAFGFAAAA